MFGGAGDRRIAADHLNLHRVEAACLPANLEQTYSKVKDSMAKTNARYAAERGGASRYLRGERPDTSEGAPPDTSEGRASVSCPCATRPTISPPPSASAAALSAASLDTSVIRTLPRSGMAIPPRRSLRGSTR